MFAVVIFISALANVFVSAYTKATKEKRKLFDVIVEFRDGFIEGGFYGFVVAVLFYFHVLQDFLLLIQLTFEVTNVVTAVILGFSADSICHKLMTVLQNTILAKE